MLTQFDGGVPSPEIAFHVYRLNPFFRRGPLGFVLIGEFRPPLLLIVFLDEFLDALYVL